MIKTAVFPVGGLGTRFLPATKAMPKEMLPIVDKPLIQFVVEEARNCGIERLVFVTGRQKHSIENHFDHMIELENSLVGKNAEAEMCEVGKTLSRPGDVIFVRQMRPLGLGHAVWCARHIIREEPFAVLLADDFIISQKSCLQQMIQEYEKKPGNYLAAMQVKEEEISQYGIVETNDIGNINKITKLIEKPDPTLTASRTAIIGRYILQPDIISILENQAVGKGGEVQLTDAIASMLEFTETFSFNFSGTRFDCGSKAGFVKANQELAKNMGLFN